MMGMTGLGIKIIFWTIPDKKTVFISDSPNIFILGVKPVIPVIKDDVMKPRGHTRHNGFPSKKESSAE